MMVLTTIQLILRSSYNGSNIIFYTGFCITDLGVTYKYYQFVFLGGVFGCIEAHFLQVNDCFAAFRCLTLARKLR